MSRRDVTKPMLKILERVFAAEIDNRLPAQPGKSKAVFSCLAADMIEPMTIHMGSVRIDGYNLTHFGRYVYCDSCKDLQIEDAK